MRRGLTVFALAFVSFTTAYAQTETPEFGLPITFSDHQILRNLMIGYDPRATVGMDTAFGEIGAPPFGVPGGSGEAFFIYQNDHDAASKINIMPKPATDTFTALYTILAYPSSGDTGYFRWDPTRIPSTVTSLKAFYNGMFLVDFKKDSSFFVVINHLLSDPHDFDNWNNAIIVLRYDDGTLDVPSSSGPAALIQSAETYPNPMVSTGTLAVTLGEPAFVTVHGYDIAGREVLMLQRQAAQGLNQLDLESMGAVHGAVMLRVEASNVSRHEVQTVMLVKD